MGNISVWSPCVKREAELFGITPLQAYRKLVSRQSILNTQQAVRFSIVK